MGPVDIAVIVIVSVAVAGVFGYLIYRKIKHKHVGCDCGCSGCDGCCSCNKEKPKD